MLYKVTKEWATSHWDILWDWLKTSLNNYVGQKEEVLKAIQKERLTLWAAVRKNDLVGLVLCMVTFQAVEKRASVLIYAAYVPEETPLTPAEWNSCYVTLSSYAATLGAVSISFYTTNQKIIHWARKVGAMVESFITLPLIPVKESSNG